MNIFIISTVVKYYGGILEVEKDLNRMCILRWITPDILFLTDCVRDFKEVHSDRKCDYFQTKIGKRFQ